MKDYEQSEDEMRNELLLDLYKLVVELNLNKDFIAKFEQELVQRGILSNTELE